MRLNGIQCDGCGKQHLFEPTLIVEHMTRTIPDGWFLVYCGKWEGDTEPLLFCSKSCCHRWSGRELTAREEQVFTGGEHA